MKSSHTCLLTPRNKVEEDWEEPKALASLLPLPSTRPSPQLVPLRPFLLQHSSPLGQRLPSLKKVHTWVGGGHGTCLDPALHLNRARVATAGMQGGSESVALELWLVCQDRPSIHPGCTSAHFMPLEAPVLLPSGVKVLLLEMGRAHT